jgi:DNA-binding MarR family transcriptional regulator
MLGAMATLLPPSLALRVRRSRERNPDTTLAALDARCVAARSAVTKGTVSSLLGIDVRFAYAAKMAQETAVSDATQQLPPAHVTSRGTAGRAPSIDATRLRVAIARLSRRLRRHELAGLTPTQLSALATVEGSGAMRLGDVAAAEGIAPSTLTRIVTALEERGYVERCAVPGDARASTLTITTRGHEIMERIRQESTAMLAESLAMLPPGQIEALAVALPALEQLAEVDPRDPQPR